jgi:hypothetical protein
MGELELDEVASKDLAPSNQNDAIGTELRPSVLKKVHRCVSVCAQVFLLKVLLIVDRCHHRVADLSKVSSYPWTHHHPKRASTMPIIFQK